MYVTCGGEATAATETPVPPSEIGQLDHDTFDFHQFLRLYNKMATPGSEIPQEGTPVPISQERSPVVMRVANFVRDHKLLKNRNGLFNNVEDIQFFRFKRFVRALLSDEYKAKSSNPKNELVPVANEQEAAKMFVMMIQSRLLVPVDKLSYQQIKEVKGWKPNRAKPTLKPKQQAVLEPNAYYAWTYLKPNPYMMLYAFLTIAGIFGVVLFPLWPRFMRVGVWYVSMGCLCLLGLFFAMAFVRLIIFVVTYLTMPQAFWLYPNLFEDCGFFESFVPLYGWSEPAGAKKIKKGKKRAEPKIQEISDDTAAASGANASSTATKKRTVTLEEVDE